MIPRIPQTDIISRHHDNPISRPLRHRKDGLAYGSKVQCTGRHSGQMSRPTSIDDPSA